MKRLLLILVISCTVFAATAADGTPDEWRTWTESHDFRSTGSYSETLEYLKKIEAALPEMNLTTFGISGQGRDMPLVIVSKDRAFTPRTAAATGKPIILIQNGIHAGEIDGKDASLMILRDMALGRGKELLDNAILLIIPIYNVDGHERVSPYWRPAQNGPVDGMGFRTNAAGLDLNRDHLKLDSPEARAVIDLFNRWRPHLHVDNHVTNGAHHDWVLTYAFVKAPQAAPPMASWVEPAMNRIVEATRKRGHSLGPYVDLLDYSDPTKGFSSYVGRAWYATGYYPLRNVPSILVENHAPKPYKDRVLTNRAFLEEIIREVNRDPKSLMDAVVASKDYITSGSSENITLSWSRDEEHPSSIQYPGRDWNIETSVATGDPVLLYDDSKPKPMDVPWVNRARADKTAPRPLGYLIQPGWPEIEERLRRHDLEFVKLTRPATLEVDTLRVSNSLYRPGSYQGRNMVGYDLEVRRETRTVPVGTLFIAAGQPDFALAVQLLEPDSPDSLASWGMMASALEWKEYISPSVLEPKVRRLLEEDPALRTEWEAALKDETFAADGNARFLWWYTRTPHWDEQVGMLPVMRLPLSGDHEQLLDALPPLLPGPWTASLKTPGGMLPFMLEFIHSDTGLQAIISNGLERRDPVPVTLTAGDTFRITLEPYEAFLSFKVHGGHLQGEYRKRLGDNKWRKLPLDATVGSAAMPSLLDCEEDALSGRWQVQFENDPVPSVGMFRPAPGECRIQGTFLNATGDYRYLAGDAYGGHLSLSTFDGAHTFLFKAELQDDGTLKGDFWSGDSYHETWTARKDPDAALPDPFGQTTWSGTVQLSELKFPDLDGNIRSLADPAFHGKARIIEVMGTWCPNCNDATADLVKLDRKYRDRGLSIVALAFEVSGEFATDSAQVKRYVEHHGIEFPVLLAGEADKDTATEAVQGLDQVRSFPTTIFLDRDGNVRAVHSGYSGPATGDAYQDQLKKYETLIESLLQ